MRGIWVDNGQEADWTKMARLSAGPYFDVRDPQAANHVNTARSKGYTPGVYLCSQGDGWPSASKLTGKQWATWAYQQVQRVAGDEGRDVRVCLNCEVHDPAWIIEMLGQWRRHSPKRETSWALEGGQGGLFSPAVVKIINDRNVDVVVELFHGGMQPQAPGTVYELLRIGFNPARLWAFYDGARLPYNFKALGGLVFTQGRIP